MCFCTSLGFAIAMAIGAPIRRPARRMAGEPACQG